jgi:murein DD-endopeptidase MepM/ murein hydrolase activator NlpD
VTSPSLDRGRLRRAAGALLVLGIALVSVTGALAAGPEQTRKELNAARKQVERLRDELGQLRKQMEATQAEVQAITARISQATAAKEALESAIHQTDQRIERSREESKQLQGQLDERARTVYIQGPTGALDLVLGAHSLPDLSDRIMFLDVLNRSDANLAAGVAAERETLTKGKANLRRYEREKEQLLARLTGERVELEEKFAELQSFRERYQDRYEEAKERAKELSKKLARQLAAQFAVAPGGSVGPPVAADGPLFWCPVDPPRSYSSSFGAPRVGHTHQGNDIFAPEGTPIRAPFAGRAEEGYDGLGGIVVHVYGSQNGGDYVYNAHLSRHAGVDGQFVGPGDLIGYVGNTGNASGTSPHDHFEYHPGGGSAVDPYPYLNEVCGLNGTG